nr:YadA-like family protein [uncultured Desulfuromonas sp.]
MKRFLFCAPFIISTLLGSFSTTTWADAVILDDLIVTGSTCIGEDCEPGEDFGSNTLILKEEDIRIEFQDTSATGSFPTQDWEMIINSCEDGGDDFFAISDGNDPDGYDFIVDPGTNSFHIMEDRIEVGTAADTRLLSNVADGIDATDAATVGQLQPVQDTLDALLDAGTNAGVVVNNLQTQADTMEASINNISSRLDTAETQGTNLSNRLDTIQQDLTTQGIALSSAQEDLATLDTTVSTLVAQSDATSTTLASQAATLEGLDTQVSANSEAISALQSTIGPFSATGDGEGDTASATGTGSTAVGAGASAHTRDTAIGYNATVTADGSVALGADSLVESENSVAVGADSQVSTNAAGGVAIGQNATVTDDASGSVAIGQDSVASEANTVSVGSVGSERRITSVADGVNDTDAVNLGQLRNVEAELSSHILQVDRKIKHLEQRLDQVGAVSSAFSALVPNPRDPSPTQISLGLGHYSGATALAAGVFHSPSDTILLNTGISTAFDTNTTAGRAGITFGW